MTIACTRNFQRTLLKSICSKKALKFLSKKNLTCPPASLQTPRILEASGKLWFPQSSSLSRKITMSLRICRPSILEYLYQSKKRVTSQNTATINTKKLGYWICKTKVVPSRLKHPFKIKNSISLWLWQDFPKVRLRSSQAIFLPMCSSWASTTRIMTAHAPEERIMLKSCDVPTSGTSVG